MMGISDRVIGSKDSPTDAIKAFFTAAASPEFAGLRAECRGQTAVSLVEHRPDALLFGGEATVERSLGDFCPLGELRDGRRSVAAFDESGSTTLRDAEK